jgi:predicted MFS family arabinose efflux permease
MSLTASVAVRARAALRAGPLNIRGFRMLAAGQLASTAGDYCYAVALPWLVLSGPGRQSRPALLGIVLACYGIPRTVLIPVGGILADKLGPRRLMLGADAGRCVVVALLAFFAAGGWSSIEALGPAAALIGAGEGLFVPASFAIMPTLVEPAQLQAANALSSAMVQAGSLAGPVLGGVLVAFGGSTPALAVDAASFAVSAITLALIPAPGPAAREVALAGVGVRARAPAGEGAGAPDGAGAPAGRAGPGPPGEAALAAAGDAGRGPPGAGRPTVWQLVRTERLLQVILVVSVAANLASGGTFEVALPALAHARFGAVGYGSLLACFAGGALAGTLVSARAKALSRPAMVGCSAFLLEAAAMSLLPFVLGLPGAATAILLVGAANGFGNVIIITLIQQWAPSAVLGRVMSLVMLAAMGSFPLSVAVSGLLVRQLGPSPFFPIAGITIGAAIVFALSQRELRMFGGRPARETTAGETTARV